MAPVPGTIALTIKSTLDGGVVMTNNLHFVWSNTDPTTEELQTVCDAFAATGTNGLADKYKGMLRSVDTLNEFQVTQVPDPAIPADPVLAVVKPVNVVGDQAAGTLTVPRECCPTVTLQTGVRGRRFRGRLFLPPPRDPTTLNGEDFLSSSTYWSNLNQFVQQLLKTTAPAADHLTGALADLDLSVFSKPEFQHDATHRGTPVLGLRLNKKAHWLRSRAK